MSVRVCAACAYECLGICARALQRESCVECVRDRMCVCEFVCVSVSAFS